MYLPDLSAYIADKLTLPNVVAIGWLSSTHDYPKGAVESALVTKLTELAIFKSVRFTDDVHQCEFCAQTEVTAEIGGVVRMLGSAEIWLPAERGDVVFAAPNLILHYISAHQYQPPDEYLIAVAALDTDAWAPRLHLQKHHPTLA